MLVVVVVVVVLMVVGGCVAGNGDGVAERH
jgi:hypothetical protein